MDRDFSENLANKENQLNAQFAKTKENLGEKMTTSNNKIREDYDILINNLSSSKQEMVGIIDTLKKKNDTLLKELEPFPSKILL